MRGEAAAPGRDHVRTVWDHWRLGGVLQKPRQEEVQGRHGFSCVDAAAAAAQCGGHYEQSGKYCFHKFVLICSSPVRTVNVTTDGAAASKTINPDQPSRMHAKNAVPLAVDLAGLFITRRCLSSWNGRDRSRETVGIIHHRHLGLAFAHAIQFDLPSRCEKLTRESGDGILSLRAVRAAVAGDGQ